jgi:hypothetical protein
LKKPKKKKVVTRQRAALMLARAVTGSRRLGLGDVAARYERMDVDEYSRAKGLEMVNPLRSDAKIFLGRKKMSETLPSDPRTKAEIIGENQEMWALLDDIWGVLVDEESEGAQEVCELLSDFDDERFPFDTDGDDAADDADDGDGD